MSLETLTLPTNKSVTVINNNVRTLRQSEKGLVLPVIILDANGSAYDLTGKQIIFSENKTEGKIVVDDGTDSQSGKFEVVDAKAGRFNYTLQDQVYSASGEAWFEIKSGDTVLDTTKNFKFNVLEQANIHVNNDNYVSTMNALENHLRGVIQKSEQSINQVSTDLTNSVNQAKNSANAAINSAANNAKTTLANMQNELNSYTAKYQSLENEWKTEQTSIQTKADQQLASLKSTADKARTDAINQINSAKDAAIKTANDNFTKKLADFQNDYNSWKSKSISDFQTQINNLKKQLDQENSTATALNSKLSELQKSVDAVKTDFSKVDFTKFVRSVNGITPDNNGNVSLRVCGVNLIRGSEMNSESQKYWKVENVKSGGSVTWDGEVVKVLNADVTQVISVKPNTTYTFSFFLKYLGGSSEGKGYESAFFFVEYTGSGLSKTTSVYNDHKFSGTIFPNTLGRSDKKITFTTQPDCYAIKLIIRQEDATVHDFEVKELQLEIGDFATDYSPATADVYDAISNAGQVKSVNGVKPDANGDVKENNFNSKIVTSYDVTNRKPTYGTATTNSSGALSNSLVDANVIDQLAKAINYVTIDAATDLNTFTTHGRYKMVNPRNTNVPSWLSDKRGWLIVLQYDNNAKTQIWFPIVGNFDLGVRYWKGSTPSPWKEIPYQDEVMLTSGGSFSSQAVFQWSDNTVGTRLGGLQWNGQTDVAKIYGAVNGNDNLDLAFDLGDDGSNHFSFRNKGAEVAAIQSNGHFTGTVDWSSVQGKPDISSLQNQLNELKATQKKEWTGTQAQYDAMTTKDVNTFYYITG